MPCRCYALKRPPQPLSTPAARTFVYARRHCGSTHLLGHEVPSDCFRMDGYRATCKFAAIEPRLSEIAPAAFHLAHPALPLPASEGVELMRFLNGALRREREPGPRIAQSTEPDVALSKELVFAVRSMLPTRHATPPLYRR